MAIKDQLSAKIDTEQAWENVKYGNYWEAKTVPKVGNVGSVPGPWWAQREHQRLTHGVYQTTEVLDNINKMSYFFVHVSLEDPQFIAYTPDAEAGKRDKQVKVSLGRFLVKYFPLYSDHYIGELVAEHKGDLSNEIEYLTRAEDIVFAYRNGVHSCMVHEFANLPCHPASLYETPGVSLAVLRDSEGRVNARSLIVEKDGVKSYIRHYGDQKLLRRIKKLGMKPGNFTGLRFKAVPLPEKFDQYVMPYLDGNGNAGTTDTSTVALVDGEVWCVEPSVRLALRKANSHLSCAVDVPGSSGYVTLAALDSSSFKYQDYISGEIYSELEHESVQFYHNDELHRICAKHMPEGLLYPKTMVGGNTVRVYAPEETKVFRHQGADWIDNLNNRAELDYVMLSYDLYPENREWYNKERYSTPVVWDETAQGWVLKSDTVKVVCTNEEYESMQTVSMHKSRLDKKLFVKLESIENVAYYTAEKELVKRTLTGKKVIPDIHRVRELWDGNYDFNRNCLSFACLGEHFFYNRKSANLPDREVGGEFWTKVFNSIVEKAVPVSDAMYCVLSHGPNFYYRYSGGSAYSNQGLPWRATRQQVLKAMLAMENDNETLAYVRTFYSRFMAEAEAQSYSDSGEVCSSKVEMPDDVATLRSVAAYDGLEEDRGIVVGYDFASEVLNTTAGGPVTVQELEASVAMHEIAEAARQAHEAHTNGRTAAYDVETTNGTVYATAPTTNIWSNVPITGGTGATPWVAVVHNF